MNDLIKNADGEKEEEVRYWKTSGGTCAAIINKSPLILDIELGGYEKLKTGRYIFDGYIPISITNIYQTQTVRLLRHFDVMVSDKLFERFEKIKDRCYLTPWGNGHEIRAKLNLIEDFIKNCTTTIGYRFELLDFRPTPEALDSTFDDEYFGHDEGDANDLD